MTATRDRRGDLDDDRAEPAWAERPILGRSRGLPWWGAVLLALGLTAVAAVIDMQSQGTLGTIYQGAYIGGCVAAICLVRRRNLFGPIVQPPLVFAVTAIGAFVVFGPSAGGGLKQLVFTVALPLTSNFPTMAITTGVVLAIGLFRLFGQRDPDARSREDAGDEPPARRKRPAERPVDEPRRRPAEDRRPRDERRPRPAEDRARPRADDGRADERPRRPREEPGRPKSDGRATPARRPARDEDRRPQRRPRPER